MAKKGGSYRLYPMLPIGCVSKTRPISYWTSAGALEGAVSVMWWGGARNREHRGLMRKDMETESKGNFLEEFLL